jgi:hypothetical protein
VAGAVDRRANAQVQRQEEPREVVANSPPALPAVDTRALSIHHERARVSHQPPETGEHQRGQEPKGPRMTQMISYLKVFSH